MHFVKENLKTTSYTYSSFLELLNKIVFMNKFGTKELTKSGLPSKINNVTDLFKALEDYILSPRFAETSEQYFKSLPKIGDFHIYQDKRPMNFIKADN